MILHVLYETKPVVMMREGDLPTELDELFQRVTDAQDTYYQMKIKCQNHRVQPPTGPAPNLFN